MTQSNFIAVAIFVAFVVYITAKGRLPLYMGFLIGSSSTGTASAGSSILRSPLGVLKGFNPAFNNPGLAPTDFSGVTTSTGGTLANDFNIGDPGSGDFGGTQ